MIRHLTHSRFSLQQMLIDHRSVSIGLFLWLVVAANLVYVPAISAQQPAQIQSGTQVQDVPPSERIPTPLEQKVKAAYLYNFSKYFDWPEKTLGDPGKPFVIGVLGKDSLGQQLDKLAKKKSVKNRKIVVTRFDTMSNYQDCHLLFVTRSVTDEEFQAALQHTNSTSVLVVSERPIHKSKGSAVQLFVDETETVGFEIDVEIVNGRRLQVSAKLLKLARVSQSQTSSK